jgi:hypothetical protein
MAKSGQGVSTRDAPPPGQCKALDKRKKTPGKPGSQGGKGLESFPGAIGRRQPLKGAHDGFAVAIRPARQKSKRPAASMQPHAFAGPQTARHCRGSAPCRPTHRWIMNLTQEVEANLLEVQRARRESKTTVAFGQGELERCKDCQVVYELDPTLVARPAENFPTRAAGPRLQPISQRRASLASLRNKQPS